MLFARLCFSLQTFEGHKSFPERLPYDTTIAGKDSDKSNLKQRHRQRLRRVSCCYSPVGQLNSKAVAFELSHVIPKIEWTAIPHRLGMLSFARFTALEADYGFECRRLKFLLYVGCKRQRVDLVPKPGRCCQYS